MEGKVSMPDRVRIFALGGLDEEGRDCYVVEVNDDIFVLDAGMSLPDKTLPGVDLLIPNFEYLIKNKNKIKGYFITHGHDEAMGALKYFYDFAPAPVYCTQTTAQYLVSQSRLYRIKPNFKIQVVKPTDKVFVNNREVRLFQTCHNVANSFGVAIHTDRGYVVYTSDFIVDYTVKDEGFKFDLKALSQIAEEDTLILLSESKTADRDGYCAPKHRSRKIIEKYFKEQKRLFISCFWENVFRIKEIINLCIEHKKKVYFYNEYTSIVIRFMMESDGLNLPKDYIVASEDLLRVRRDELVVLMLGHGGEIYEEMTKLSTGRNEDRRIILDENDIFIVGSIATPTLEVLATRCIDNLYRSGCEVVWLKNKELSSMHARKDDLKFFLSLLKPKYYLPVRGSYTNMIENAKLALTMGIGLNHMNVFIMDNGMQLLFDDKSPRPRMLPYNEEEFGIAPIMVDGTGISKVGAEIIEDRRKLGIDGVVVIAGTFSKSQKKLVAGPDCQMRGFVYVKEAEPLLKTVNQIFIEEALKVLEEEHQNIAEAEKVIKDRTKKFIKRENGREPLVIASIFLTD